MSDVLIRTIGDLDKVDAVDALIAALRARRFVLTVDDQQLIAAADSHVVTDSDSYTGAFDVMAEIANLADRVTAHYKPFKQPLNRIVGAVRDMEGEDVKPLQKLKERISLNAGHWESERRRQALLDEAKRQREADERAREEQRAKADALARIAKAETDPKVAAVFQRDADQLASVAVSAAPVAPTQLAPRPGSGHTEDVHSAEIVDIRVLLRAWLDGRCHLDETAIIAGLQKQMDEQASALKSNLSHAYPGVQHVVTTRAIAVRRRR